MKVAILSQSLPPAWGGQALVILRLLRGVHPDRYCLIAGKASQTLYGGEYSEALPGPLELLPPEPRLRRPSRLGLAFARELANVAVGVSARAWRVRRILRGRRADVLVAFTGDLIDLPAGLLASRLQRVRFVAYVLDDFREREVGAGPDARARTVVAGILEAQIFRHADAVVVANELMQDELRKRYAIQAEVIHNSTELSEYQALPPARARARNGHFRLVYTGTVYDAHYDAFRNLVNAIRGTPGAVLDVYTAQAPEVLRANGLDGPTRIHPYLATDRIPAVQHAADTLFLPLAFASPYPDVIRTSAPFKLGEYLASGRPILVHAPHDSFVATYTRRHGCGLVVDEPDPGALRSAIEQLRDDTGLRERLAAAAWRRAVADFDAERAREQFGRLVGISS